jgi:hypothetical protein
VLKYRAEGDASDWFLGEKGILSVSPMLGTDEHWSAAYQLSSVERVKTVCSQNYPQLFYLIRQMQPSLDFKLVRLGKAHEKIREIDLSMHNEGFGAITNDTTFELKLILNMTLFSTVVVKLEGQMLGTTCSHYHCTVRITEIQA